MSIAANRIYCDEAGFTGNDLLNDQQRFFVVGSTDIEDSYARDLISELVNRFKLQAEFELKGANLIRHGKGRMALKWLMRECNGHFHIVYNHKLYAIAAKFFEAFFEPLLAQHSLFFYKTDFHRFISNAIYYGLRTNHQLAVGAIENVQSTFSRSVEPVETLFRPDDMVPDDVIGAIFDFCKLNESAIRPLLSEYKDRSLYKWYLDLSLSSLQTTLIYWGKRYGDVEVVCDDSKPLADNVDIALLAGLAAEGMRILRPVEIANFKVNKLEFGRSHEHAGLQLADLFASAACSSLNRGDKFFDDMTENHPSSLGNFNVRPAVDFIDLRNEKALRNGLVLLRLIESSKGQNGLKLDARLMGDLAGIHSLDFTRLIP